MKRIVILLAIGLAVWTAAAQTGVSTIGGRITDDNGPIEGVTVVAIHQGTNSQYYATTDRHGWWQMLDVVPGGPYTVRIHYFGYNPLTVRGVFTYPGQNVVVDADMEAGTTDVHSDEAASSYRLGESLGGGYTPLSPREDYGLLGQRVLTPVPFDVRYSAGLGSDSRQFVTRTGSNRFHLSAYDYFYGGNMAGATLATPLGSEDFQLFGGAQYDTGYGFSGVGRIDARLGSSMRFEAFGGRLASMYSSYGGDAWAGAGLTNRFEAWNASNRAQFLWYDDGLNRGGVVSDDFTVAAGPQRLLLGVQAARLTSLSDGETSTRFDFYVQDVLRAGRRITLTAGVRFSFPFTFSPRVSVYYDVLGNGNVVLRAGTAVYGVHGGPSTWKSLAALDTKLPADFKLTVEGIYAQSWAQLFIISPKNLLDTWWSASARVERPLSRNLQALAGYWLGGGLVRQRIASGLSYKAEYAGRFATSLSVLYRGEQMEDLSSSVWQQDDVLIWMHALEVRLDQDLGVEIGGRGHSLQLTGYMHHYFSGRTMLMAGVRYIL